MAVNCVLIDWMVVVGHILRSHLAAEPGDLED